VAIVAQSGLCWVLAVLNSFERLAIIANVSAALVYLGCAAAAWRLRRMRVRQMEGVPFAIPGGALAPFLAIVAILFLLSAVTAREWSVLVVVLGAASALYLASGRRRSRAATGAGEGAGAAPETAHL
jgi:L-asparagine transporter-like permease